MNKEEEENTLKRQQQNECKTFTWMFWHRQIRLNIHPQRDLYGSLELQQTIKTEHGTELYRGCIIIKHQN